MSMTRSEKRRDCAENDQRWRQRTKQTTKQNNKKVSQLTTNLSQLRNISSEGLQHKETSHVNLNAM